MGAVGPAIEPISCLHGGVFLRVVQSSVTGISHALKPNREQDASSRRLVPELGLAVPKNHQGGTLSDTSGKAGGLG